MNAFIGEKLEALRLELEGSQVLDQFLMACADEGVEVPSDIHVGEISNFVNEFFDALDGEFDADGLFEALRLIRKSPAAKKAAIQAKLRQRKMQTAMAARKAAAKAASRQRLTQRKAAQRQRLVKRGLAGR